jgi:hypothetical protein
MDFSVRSDNVDVEQIMRQIRARIRDKRGVDYTEDEIRELANVRLEKFLDPKGVRSDLLQQYRASRETSDAPRNFAFEDTTLYASSRPLLQAIRRLLNPLLKLFINPNPMIEALHIQSRLNDSYNRSEALYYELVHNLVLETTRLGLEVKSLKMRLESMASRLDFDERRARALEGVVQYRPGAVPPLQPPTGQRDERRDHGQGQPGQQGQRAQAQFSNALDTEGAERRSRRRRRRGRRRGQGSAFGGGEHGGGAGGTTPASADHKAADAGLVTPSAANEHHPSDMGHRPSDGGRRLPDGDRGDGGGSSAPPADAPSE